MPMRCTLLDLVSAVHSVADSEEEVVATAVHLVNCGQVQGRGTFTGAKIRLAPMPVPSVEPFFDALAGLRAPGY